METVLYSCFGTSDPVRGMHDGGFMHILRFYRPAVVYLFLSKEIEDTDRKDRRIDMTFDFIRENWGGYAPIVKRMNSGIQDPSDMDALMEPMDALLRQVLEENPGAEILLNLSSGTPQMQIILAQMALDPRYKTKGIQVKSPEKSSGTTERTNKGPYPIEEALGLNEDEEPGAPSRCCVPRMTAIRREAVRNQLRSLLDQRNYAAIAQMHTDLPEPIPKLARHLDYRSHFHLKEAEAAAAGLQRFGLQVGRGKYAYPEYEMIEYFAVLKNLVQLRRYTDLVLRLNPFVVRLQTLLLQGLLRKRGLTERDLIALENGRKKLRADQIRGRFPELAQKMATDYNIQPEARDISIWIMNILLEYFQVEEAAFAVLKACEQCNARLRNSAAHDLFAVSGEDIQTACGMRAEELVRKLEKLLTEALAHYGDKGLKRRLNIYACCDQIIRECI